MLGKVAKGICLAFFLEKKFMYKAITDRLIIELDKIKISKIISFETEKNLTNQGTVKSVGDSVTQAKVGDKVVFHCFDELPLPSENLVIIREKSLLAKY